MELSKKQLESLAIQTELDASVIDLEDFMILTDDQTEHPKINTILMIKMLDSDRIITLF